MDAYDRVDLHQKIMNLLRGRIKMGAGVKAGRKRRVGRPRLHRAGEDGGDMLTASGRKRRVHRRKAGVTAGKRRVGRPRIHRAGMTENALLKELMGHGEGEGEGVRRRRRVVRRKRAGCDYYDDHLSGQGLRHKKRRAGSDYYTDHLDGMGRRQKVHRKRAVGVKHSSPWIKHVKAYAKAHGISYGEAMSKARASYRG